MKLSVVCTAVLSAGLLACGYTDTEPVILASWNDGTISSDEYQSWLRGTGATDSAESRPGNLRQLVLTKTLAEERRQRGDLSEVAALTLRVDVDRILSQAYLTSLESQIEISPDQVNEYLAEHDAERQQPKKVQLRSLYKRVSPAADGDERSKARETAEGWRERLLAGADFDELARHESDSQSALRGGRMGVAEPGDLPPEVERIVFELQAGELSPVIGARNGFFLFRADRIIEPRVMPLERARERVQRFLHRQQWKPRQERVRNEIFEALQIEIRSELLQRPEGLGPDTVVVESTADAISLREARRLLADPKTGIERSVRPAAARRILEEHLLRRELARRARDAGLDREPLVRDRIDWTTRRRWAADELRLRVADRFQPPTDGEIRDHYEQHRSSFRHPEERRVRVVRRQFSTDDRDAVAEQMNALEVSLRAAETTMEEIARSHSDHPSAPEGGDLGWRTRLQIAELGPTVSRTVERLEIGEVSSLLVQDGAFWLVRLEGRRAERFQSLAEVRDQIAKDLGTQRARDLHREVESDWLKEVASDV